MNNLTASRLARTALLASVLTSLCWAASLAAQEKALLPPSALYQPLTTDWPSYSGDYTGQRFSRRNNIITSMRNSMIKKVF